MKNKQLTEKKFRQGIELLSEQIWTAALILIGVEFSIISFLTTEIFLSSYSFIAALGFLVGAYFKTYTLEKLEREYEK